MITTIVLLAACVVSMQSHSTVRAAGIRRNVVQRTTKFESSHSNLRRELGVKSKRESQGEKSGLRNRRSPSEKVSGREYYEYEYDGLSGYPKSEKGKGKQKKGLKGKGSDAFHDDVDHDDYELKCIGILGSSWTFTAGPRTHTHVDVDADLTISSGDQTIFDAASVRVTSSIDGSIIATASLDGTCTVPPSLGASRRFCQLVFDFGKAGSVSAQGPLGKMTITGVTGCFYRYFGVIYGDLLGSQEYGFSVDSYER